MCPVWAGSGRVWGVGAGCQMLFWPRWFPASKMTMTAVQQGLAALIMLNAWTKREPVKTEEKTVRVLWLECRGNSCRIDWWSTTLKALTDDANNNDRLVNVSQSAGNAPVLVFCHAANTSRETLEHITESPEALTWPHNSPIPQSSQFTEGQKLEPEPRGHRQS